jgi:hypothetical protein
MPQKVFRPFDIVLTKFLDDSNMVQDGIFMLFYSEQIDLDVLYHKNICGFKITSRPEFMDKYFYAIDKERHPFLDKEISYVQLNKLFTLHIKQCRYLGSLDNAVRMSILSKFLSAQYSINKSMIDNIRVYYPRKREDN